MTQDCWVCVSTRDFAEACLKDEPMSMVVPRSPIGGGEHANTHKGSPFLWGGMGVLVGVGGWERNLNRKEFGGVLCQRR